MPLPPHSEAVCGLRGARRAERNQPNASSVSSTPDPIHTCAHTAKSRTAATNRCWEQRHNIRSPGHTATAICRRYICVLEVHHQYVCTYTRAARLCTCLRVIACAVYFLIRVRRRQASARRRVAASSFILVAHVIAHKTRVYAYSFCVLACVSVQQFSVTCRDARVIELVCVLYRRRPLAQNKNWVLRGVPAEPCRIYDTPRARTIAHCVVVAVTVVRSYRVCVCARVQVCGYVDWRMRTAERQTGSVTYSRPASGQAREITHSCKRASKVTHTHAHAMHASVHQLSGAARVCVCIATKFAFRTRSARLDDLATWPIMPQPDD